jgi:TolB-like protein/Tfp pilus assembly protein PilF
MSPEPAKSDFLRRSEEVYQGAVPLAGPQRAVFLDRACAGDESLRREVESLLEAHDRAANFLESPAIEVAGELYGGGQAASRVGRQIGRFRITGTIGSGGMGEVYRAEDPRLDRPVAIKVLPPHLSGDAGALSRFKREAKAVAALSHPNILALHDFDCDGDTHFAVMELLEGETVAARLRRGRMEWQDAAETAAAVADGLAAAHQRGIVHRDIKPDNIFLTGDGRVKILDFGIASRSTGAHAATQTQVTGLGFAIGTIGYMAPEQLRGEAAGPPADLFSLGCVLYEMVTGRRAFLRTAAADTVAAILGSEPPPMNELAPEAPSSLQSAAQRCLRKQAAERFASARDLAIALRQIREGGTAAAIGRPGAARSKAWIAAATVLLAAAGALFGPSWRTPSESAETLAILPIANRSGDAGLEYIGDGITENLIDNLSALPRLKVMARTTAFRQKGRNADALTIGRELKVRRVVSGRLLRDGDSFALEMEAVNVADGAQLWNARYVEKASNLGALPETISGNIAESLRIGLKPAERKAWRHTQDPEAYRLYLAGLYHWSRRDWNPRNDDRKAIELFQQAIDKDPLYAMAYVGLADAYSSLTRYEGSGERENARRAKAAALKALEIDGGLAEAQVTLASILHGEWNWPEAEKAFRRALELNPGNATGHGWYAVCLDAMGRTKEAVAEARRALELDPLSSNASLTLGSVLYDDRQYERAIEQQRRTLELNPDSGIAYVHIALAMFKQRRFAEGLVELDNAEARMQGAPVVMALRGYGWAQAGRKEDARELLRRYLAAPPSPYRTGLDLPALYVGLGDKDRAFEALNRACDERLTLIDQIKADPLFDPLRADPRYAELLGRMNLTP